MSPFVSALTPSWTRWQFRGSVCLLSGCWATGCRRGSRGTMCRWSAGYRPTPSRPKPSRWSVLLTPSGFPQWSITFHWSCRWKMFVCALFAGEQPGTEGAAEGVAPPSPWPRASSPAAGAHQEEREAQEGGGESHFNIYCFCITKFKAIFNLKESTNNVNRFPVWILKKSPTGMNQSFSL